MNDKKAEFVRDKLGIDVEEGEKVRTKDIFKQLILKEALKDDDDDGALTDESREVPIGERSSELGADEDQSGEEPVQEKTKKELRDERKRKLLENIFK